MTNIQRRTYRLLPAILLCISFSLPLFARQTESGESAKQETASTQSPQASQSAEKKFFRLDFVVKELDGKKIVESRSYFMLVASDSRERNSIRTGNRVPVPTGSASSQYNYLDVGTNIDCSSVTQVGTQLAMHITADISSIADKLPNPQLPAPLLRQNRWESQVVIPVGKPAVVFSSDDITTNRTIQFEITATPLH